MKIVTPVDRLGDSACLANGQEAEPPAAMMQPSIDRRPAERQAPNRPGAGPGDGAAPSAAGRTPASCWPAPTMRLASS
jgi:hypothetical protein